MVERIALPAFGGGEIGPSLQSRFDTAKYQTALRKARNVFAMTAGGVYGRPGFRWVGEAHTSSEKMRLFPFQFSLDQQYQLEFSHLRMRVIYNGGYVLRPELIVTAITKAANAQITAPANGYSVGDDVYFTNIEGMTEINGSIGRVVTVTPPDVFTVDIDTTGFSTFTGSGGGVAGGGAGGVEGDPAVPPTVPPTFEDVEIPPIVIELPFGNGGYL